MTDHQQAALTAMQDEIYRQLNCQYGDFNIPSNEEVKAILAAAEPHLRKKVRAEVAAEIRASLPRDLAASTQDRDGWFSGMTGDLNIVVEVDEDMTPVGYGFELEAATGTIDLHLLADIAARIAEGAEEFDRWLAAHDREVAEKAWDEGFMRANRLVNCRMCRGTTVPKINPYTV